MTRDILGLEISDNISHYILMNNNFLLPDGFYDLLPIKAAQEFNLFIKLVDIFNSFGYSLVHPSMMEFEENFVLNASGSATMFRLVDPISHQTIVIRSDMTTQIARIATTKLISAPRPLRLSYIGQCLRMMSNMVRPNRQFSQAGVELIGSSSPGADEEIIELAVYVLRSIGIQQNITIDLIMPLLMRDILTGLNLTASEQDIVQNAFTHKDAKLLQNINSASAKILCQLLNMAGHHAATIKRLHELELSPKSRENIVRIETLINRLNLPENVSVTIDPSEYCADNYHTDFGFNLFVDNISEEVGRGGRYLLKQTEGAVGFTLYIDILLKIINNNNKQKNVYLPQKLKQKMADKLRSDGYAVIQELMPVSDIKFEAQRLGCDYYYDNDKLIKVN